MASRFVATFVRPTLQRSSMTTGGMRRLRGGGYHEEPKVGDSMPIPLLQGNKSKAVVWVPIFTMCAICFGAVKFQLSKK